LYLFKTPRIIKWLYPSLVWNGPGNERNIYLTFDDGPVSGVSENILKILARFNVKATFFCVGENVSRNPELFMRIIREGHMIGNHTFHHLNGWKVGDDEYITDIRKCDTILEENGFDNHIKLFRPPYGKIRRSAINKIRMDYRIIMWDVLSYDFSVLPSEKLLGRCRIHARPGSIIVFHDSLKTKKKTEFILSQLIVYLMRSGYKFNTLDRLFLTE
jgi:peptidoglycan-N-acetylglucosamine deacetylase